MTQNWLKTLKFIYPFSIVELIKVIALKNTHFKFLLYIVKINPLIPLNPLNYWRGPNFFSFVIIPHQTLSTCKILAQYIQRFKICGGGQTDRQTDRPTDRQTLENIGILANPKTLKTFKKMLKTLKKRIKNAKKG